MARTKLKYIVLNAYYLYTAICYVGIVSNNYDNCFLKDNQIIYNYIYIYTYLHIIVNVYDFNRDLLRIEENI